MTTRNIKLNTTADWDVWFHIVKTKATCFDIWELVDPAQTTKPEHLECPVAPSYVVPTHPTPINNVEKLIDI